ncbi:MAG TPA: CDP-alcohol phosphatidyltransferase family protein, partial [Nakamurella sp.]
VGARFDMEVDAFLVLVLALYDVRLLGGWVLLIGAARYLFVAAGWVWPGLRDPTPPRYWGKVVAAIQGVVLAVAMADLLPRPVATLATVAALGLLVESFGRQVWWLYRHARSFDHPESLADSTADRGRSAIRRTLAAVTTALALALVWFSLVAPSEPAGWGAVAFLRIPLEALVVVGVVLLLPPRPGRVVAVLCGAVLGVLTVVKLLDIGFRSALGRPFNPLSDWAYAGSFVELLGDSLGEFAAVAIGIGIVVTMVALLVTVPLAVRRLTRLAGRDRAVTYRFVGAFGAVWLVGATVGLQVSPGAPLAAAEAAGQAYREVTTVRSTLADRQDFQDRLAAPVAAPGSLSGLRGKDVVIVFIESYGRVAIEDQRIAPGVDAVLDNGTRQLTAAGFTCRSAFLTSPTFGGISWLAHATLQSGLWVDSQPRYDQLMLADRPTLTSAFGRAGWRTVLDAPANTRDWPEAASFYHADQVYDARTVGYRGPPFAFDAAPDQYTLAHFRRTELTPANRAPVMAEIDLLSSHSPWVPLPELVDWTEIGDGGVFAGMPDRSPSVDDVWADRDRVRAAYGATIEYSLSALISFLLSYGDENLVLVILGDHQPTPIVSGDAAGHDVPVTIVGKDPAVFTAIDSWGWPNGLNPDPQAPVWRMDAFHDRFLSAFGG